MNQFDDAFIDRKSWSYLDLLNQDARSLPLSKKKGVGIQVDRETPTFGWHDILGRITTRTPGANDPVSAVYRASGGITVSEWQCQAALTEIYFDYHIPHDYVPESDLHVHVHWSQNVVDTGGTAGAPGQAKFYFDVTYAKGHNQEAFDAPIQTSVTQTASATQYLHMLIETQITDNALGTLLDRNVIEPDGIIIMRFSRNSADAADTLNQDPFIHQVDLHYQSTNVGTKQKAPDFWT